MSKIETLDPERRADFERRFWAKVDKSGGPDACWEWSGCRCKDGYGKFGVRHDDYCASLRAHRVSYKLTYGTIPDGLCVLHHCDNRLCSNPTHLFLGTRADNNADKCVKGRAPRGEQNKRTKLTESDVRVIRKLLTSGVPQRTIARQFGVAATAISAINRGLTWGWLSDEALEQAAA